MKKNNILIAVLVVLVLLYVSTNYLKKNRSTAFDPEIIELDTAAIDKLSIYPPARTSEEPIHISRSQNGWEVSRGTIRSKANQTLVKSALGQLQDIKAQRLVAKTEDKWASYELTDSLARKLEIQDKDGGTSTVYFGKTSYDQPATPQYGPASTTGSTYFRINDRPETYTLKNQIASAFNRTFNTWRNSEFIKLKEEDIKEVKFERAGEEAFSLLKKDSTWTLSGLQADSTKVARYLNTLRNQSSSRFADDFEPKEEALRTLTVRGASMDDLVVKAYAGDSENEFLLHSSQHPETYIESDSTGLYKRLFVDKQHFIKEND
ncbi:DUF4340 domain-containing protein [Pseudozobellia thermophila]|uniref:DUF4340 domain-containing protein n=1 Tax=Pseudozobellia thermophila TaxID=192903 RepID=A0A1M6CTW5_9FLAO|nr:DUF4340 domain-containing protein [Pseudozobellia thermophila]SHI64333.1 protein of unknown function [Pseudozobellia thermophila]